MRFRDYLSCVAETLLKGASALSLPRVCLLLSIGCAFPLPAQNPGRAITQFAHRSWGEQGGYPGLTYAIAQTPDGFLWLGSTAGLYRFDGIHFQHYASPAGDTIQSGSVRSLLALPDGDLWVGYATGGLSLLRNGRVTNYGQREGVPNGAVRHIVGDHEGRIWITTEEGLARFDGHRWEPVGKDWNCPKQSATALFVDSRGTVWAAIGNLILYLKQGTHRFEDTGEFALQANSLAEAPDGHIWMADTSMAVRPIGMPGSPRLATARCEAQAADKGLRMMGPLCNSATQLEIQVGSAGILFDRDGGLWITTVGDGLRRSQFPLGLKSEPILEHSRAVESFTFKEGLSADYALAAFQDREGNIWIGTRDGLDEFRETTLVPVFFPTETIQISIAPDVGGYVWVVSNQTRVGRLYGDSTEVPLTSIDAVALYRDHRGSVWLKGNAGVSRLIDGHIQPKEKFPLFWGKLSPDRADEIQVAGNNAGKLWVFAKGLGFSSLDGHTWKGLETPPEVARLTPSSAYTDPTGRIWIGFDDGTIATLEQESIATYPARNVGLGTIASITTRESQVWIGGSRGLSVYKSGLFRHVLPWDKDSFSEVSGVVDAGSDGLWLNEDRGVICIPAAEVSKVLKAPSYRVRYDVFDSSDGLPGRSQDHPPYPSATRGTDGRLWFAAKRGIVWVNPAKTVKNLIPPPVHVTALSADGSLQPHLDNMKIPPLASAIQISYTALSFTVPERVRFRYRLDGVDKGWQEPETRREAYYSRLSPGRYHFRVIACNNDGVWNEQGDTLDFSVLPAWYQTSLFRVFGVAVLLCLIWVFHRVRVWQIASAMSARYDERLAERTRIAGDLHDTLLQTIDVSKLVAQDAVAENYDDLRMRRALEKLSVWLEKASEEARAALKSLRSSAMPGIDLATALQLASQNEFAQRGLEATFSVVGALRELSPIVRDEGYRIGCEAIRNAQMHCAGSLLEVEIVYGVDLELTVRDNGIGMAAAVCEHGKDDHFGLEGMRYRAAQIGAKLTITSSSTFGTKVVLHVPGPIAFVSARATWLSWIVGFGKTTQ